MRKITIKSCIDLIDKMVFEAKKKKPIRSEKMLEKSYFGGENRKFSTSLPHYPTWKYQLYTMFIIEWRATRLSL